MQDSYNQPILRGRVVSLKDHQKIVSGKTTREFILFGDNLLECLALLNPSVELSDVWDFQYIVYQPHSSPRYIFKSPLGCYIIVRACGVYSNWPLPKQVADLVNKYDLPDFVLYDHTANEIVCAGELTETASVGNSQWQRELRKIAAAESSVPFIYQTVYSGFDDSQGTLREPTSLLVYNAFVYSIRYGVPSLVVLAEPNVPEAISRTRENPLDSSMTSTLVVSYMLNRIGEAKSLTRELEKKIFLSMASYLSETPYSNLKKLEIKTKTGSKSSSGSKLDPRLLLDFPCAPRVAIESLLKKPDDFVTSLLSNFDADVESQQKFVRSHDFSKVEDSKLVHWTDKRETRHIKSMFDFIEENELAAARAPRSKFAAGILDTNVVVQYLKSELGASQALIRNLQDLKETLIIPIAIHKRSNGKLMFTKDPYAGNTAAFSELLAYDSEGNRIRNVVAYCVSDNPIDFNIHTKADTSLYKCLKKYVDVMILDSRIESNLVDSKPKEFVELPPRSAQHKPLRQSEDMGIVSTFLQMGVIGSDWDACMIAIHHSSWQQIRIQTLGGQTVTAKIGRDDSKVDLVMQSATNHFLVAEGKRRFADFTLTTKESSKIAAALKNASREIDKIFGTSQNHKTMAFICVIDETDFGSECRTIESAVKSNALGAIAGQEHFVIACEQSSGTTRFELFFSPDFSIENKISFEKMFDK